MMLENFKPLLSFLNSERCRFLVGGVIFRLARQSRGFCRFRHSPNQAQPEPGQFDMAPSGES